MKWRHNTPLRYSPIITEFEPGKFTSLNRNSLEKEIEVANPVTTPASRNPVKPGVHTTEFWFTVLADVVAVLNADGVWSFLSQSHSATLAAVATAAYTLSRGWAKSGS